MNKVQIVTDPRIDGGDTRFSTAIPQGDDTNLDPIGGHKWTARISLTRIKTTLVGARTNLSFVFNGQEFIPVVRTGGKVDDLYFHILQDIRQISVLSSPDTRDRDSLTIGGDCQLCVQGCDGSSARSLELHKHYIVELNGSVVVGMHKDGIVFEKDSTRPREILEAYSQPATTKDKLTVGCRQHNIFTNKTAPASSSLAKSGKCKEGIVGRICVASSHNEFSRVFRLTCRRVGYLATVSGVEGSPCVGGRLERKQYHCPKMPTHGSSKGIKAAHPLGTWTLIAAQLEQSATCPKISCATCFDKVVAG